MERGLPGRQGGREFQVEGPATAKAGRKKEQCSKSIAIGSSPKYRSIKGWGFFFLISPDLRDHLCSKLLFYS